MNEVLTLKTRRAQILADVKDVIQRAKNDPNGERDLTAEESGKVDEMYAEFDKAGSRIETLERMTRLERSEAELRDATRRTDPNRPGQHAEQRGDVGRAVRTWLMRGKGQPTLDDLDNARRCGVDYHTGQLVIRTGNTIQRAMGVGQATAGAGLVAWREFTEAYDKAEKFFGTAANVVTNIDTETGVDMPFPTFDDTSNTGRWLAEATTVTATDPTVGSVTLKAYMASSDEIPVSIQLLQDSSTALDTFLPQLLGERIGRLKNAGITTGDGTGKPNGIFPRATASGVVFAGTVASMTMDLDKFLDLKYTVDPAYRNAPAAKRGFMMHDTLLARVRKVKDGQSRYMADPFAPGPGTLDGDPIFVNNDAPTIAANARICAYGDFSRYVLRNVMQIEFYRLDQIKIRDGQIVFLAFSRCDGNLMNVSAVKTAAAPAS